MRLMRIRRNLPHYAVQVCMPGQAYTTVTLVTTNLSDKFDVFMSIVRGTHKLSRKGMTVRIVSENPTDVEAFGSWRVIKRVRVA